uniref:HECT-type E3 ubiquitin transferase n=1 Tax=Hucho hucho TaxID=62062 RepID=A0A4W5P7K8_9TELE
MSFSFEGDFKTRPKVSLGGASKKEEKASLLHRTQEERQKREDERRRLKNAIVIQSYIRGYHDRKQQYAIQRGNFDRCVGQAQSEGGPPMSDAASLSLLTRQLLFFYRQSEDSQRLIWICQNLVKHNGQFVKLLVGPERQTCVFQIKRVLGFCCRLLQTCKDDSLNVAVPMRMLDIFSSERTYLPVLEDMNCVASLIEQILHYMVQKGYYRSLYILVNHKLPSSLEYSDAPSGAHAIPLASTLLEHTLKPLHFTYSSCTTGARQFVFAAFTEEFISAPFTEQIFHFFIPALSDPRLHFPFEAFLGSLQATVVSSSAAALNRAPWLFYFVLSAGETNLGMCLRPKRYFYSHRALVKCSALCRSRCFIFIEPLFNQDDSYRISVQLITEECVHKLDTKQQTNALLNLVWRDSASEEVFTMMASICHTLMVQHRMMVPKVRSVFYIGSSYVITNLVKMVKARDIRRPFCPAGHWLSEEVNISADKVTQLYVPSARHVWRTRRMGRIGPLQSTLDGSLSLKQLAILSLCVSVVKIFQRLIYADKRDVQGDGPLLDGIIVTIRRNYIYEDAYDKLSPENEPDLKKRVRVHLLNAHGLDEAGIDGGGIFREFLNELLKSGFNPNQGFFKTTNEGLLYPSPTAQMLVGDSFARHYYFLGRILGKVNLRSGRSVLCVLFLSFPFLGSVCCVLLSVLYTCFNQLKIQYFWLW